MRWLCEMQNHMRAILAGKVSTDGIVLGRAVRYSCVTAIWFKTCIPYALLIARVPYLAMHTLFTANRVTFSLYLPLSGLRPSFKTSSSYPPHRHPTPH